MTNSAAPQGNAPVAARPVVAPRRPNMWPVAAVLIVLLLVIGGPIGYVIIQWGRAVQTAAGTPRQLISDISHAAAEAMRPKITLNEIVLNSIDDLKKQSKLVVYTAEVNADITREEGAKSWGVYWGTNVARVAVRNARVHYAIDLSKLQSSDFIYSEQAKVLSITVPAPMIDHEMVSIDPRDIQTLDLRSGWMRWNKYETRDNAIRELRPRVLMQAQKQFVRDLAENAGMEAMTKLVQPLTDALAAEGVTVRVQYRSLDDQKVEALSAAQYPR